MSRWQLAIRLLFGFGPHYLMRLRQVQIAHETFFPGCLEQRREFLLGNKAGCQEVVAVKLVVLNTISTLGCQRLR